MAAAFVLKAYRGLVSYRVSLTETARLGRPQLRVRLAP